MSELSTSIDVIDFEQILLVTVKPYHGTQHFSTSVEFVVGVAQVMLCLCCS